MKLEKLIRNASLACAGLLLFGCASTEPQNTFVGTLGSVTQFAQTHGMDKLKYQEQIDELNRKIKEYDQDEPFGINYETYITYFYKRGAANFELDRYQSAIDDFSGFITNFPPRKLLDFKPSYSQEYYIAYFLRAQAYEKLSQYELAIEDYTFLYKRGKFEELDIKSRVCACVGKLVRR